FNSYLPDFLVPHSSECQSSVSRQPTMSRRFPSKMLQTGCPTKKYRRMNGFENKVIKNAIKEAAGLAFGATNETVSFALSCVLSLKVLLWLQTHGR
ncbi:hypothetical protein K503DRAFT_772453, partial [Rhizopogon vinicolor AM-OR11-026]